MSAATISPTRELGCCCCGNATRGRQWWNRDTGYGICPECIGYVRRHGMTDAEIRNNYGLAGVHYLESPADAESRLLRVWFDEGQEVRI